MTGRAEFTHQPAGFVIRTQVNEKEELVTRVAGQEQQESEKEALTIRRPALTDPFMISTLSPVTSGKSERAAVGKIYSTPTRRPSQPTAGGTPVTPNDQRPSPQDKAWLGEAPVEECSSDFDDESTPVRFSQPREPRVKCSPYGAEQEEYRALSDADNTSEDEREFRALMMQLDAARLGRIQKTEERAAQAGEDTNSDTSSSSEEAPL